MIGEEAGARDLSRLVVAQRGSLEGTGDLFELFWADLETHHLGIDTLKLPRDVAAVWKERVMTRTRTTRTGDGQAVTTVSARLDGRSVLTAVRAFYLDIAEWADDDPRWVSWAVRCPVSASEPLRRPIPSVELVISHRFFLPAAPSATASCTSAPASPTARLPWPPSTGQPQSPP